MFEKAYCIAAIGNDEKMAKKWNEHDDPKGLFMPVKELVRFGLTKLGFDNIDQTSMT